MKGDENGREKKEVRFMGEAEEPSAGQNTLEDLAKRRLTMCRSLQILEHTSMCKQCYETLLKNIKTKN